MTDNDYNVIKPVETLQNITGLTLVKRREERKRRQPRANHPFRPNGKDHNDDNSIANGSMSANLPTNGSEERRSTEDGQNESVNPEDRAGKLTNDENNLHSIDYCA